nr:major facilitator superfamily domain-containing protein 6-like [Penaeus vannamei]
MIDWKMFPMKLHYILRYAGTGPLMPFLPVIARQKGVSDHVVGIIWTVMPFFSLLVKTTAGALADYFRAHRAVFLASLVVMTAALTGIYWSPPIDPEGHRIAEATRDNNGRHSIANPPGTTLETLDPNATWNNLRDTSTTLDSPEGHSTPNATWNNPGRHSIANTTRDNPATSGERPPSWDVVRDTDVEGTSVGVCGGNESECLGDSLMRVELPASELATRYEFWILFLWLLLQFCGYVVVLDLQEAVCFQMLGDAPHRYGQQRLWGTISYGLAAVAGGALVDWYSKDQAQKDYWPVHVMVAVFLALDVVVVARLRFSVTDKKLSRADVHEVFRRPSVMLTVLTTVVLGLSCGMIGTFHFLLVEDVAAAWDPEFLHLKLLQGLMLGVQCLVAEVPCLFLTGWLIEKIGYVNAFLLSLSTFCLRLCLYAAVTNPWWFLPIELLHGVSYAVAFAGVASYANSVTPEGAEATMQAIFGGVFFGGMGVGGLVGGWLFHLVGGWKAFLFVGVGNGVYAILYLAAHLALERLCPAHSPSERGKNYDEVRNTEEPATRYSECSNRDRQDNSEDSEREAIKQRKITNNVTSV